MKLYTYTERKSDYFSHGIEIIDHVGYIAKELVDDWNDEIYVFHEIAYAQRNTICLTPSGTYSLCDNPEDPDLTQLSGLDLVELNKKQTKEIKQLISERIDKVQDEASALLEVLEGIING